MLLAREIATDSGTVMLLARDDAREIAIDSSTVRLLAREVAIDSIEHSHVVG